MSFDSLHGPTILLHLMLNLELSSLAVKSCLQPLLDFIKMILRFHFPHQEIFEWQKVSGRQYWVMHEVTRGGRGKRRRRRRRFLGKSSRNIWEEGRREEREEESGRRQNDRVRGREGETHRERGAGRKTNRGTHSQRSFGVLGFLTLKDIL